MPLPDHLHVPSRPVLLEAINAARRPRFAALQNDSIVVYSGWWMMTGLMISGMAGWIIAMAQMR